MDTTFLREISLLVRSPKKGIDEIFWFGTLEKGIKAGLAGWCATHILGFALGIILLPLAMTFGGFLFGFIPAVYGIFSILREILGLGIYWFVGSFILWKLLSVLLERDFDFKQVLMGTAYVEGYTGALGLALILVSIICIYITPFLNDPISSLSISLRWCRYLRSRHAFISDYECRASYSRRCICSSIYY